MLDFVQILECTVEVTERRAHARIASIRKETKGLLGVTRDGKVYKFNYLLNEWFRFSNWEGTMPDVDPALRTV